MSETTELSGLSCDLNLPIKCALLLAPMVNYSPSITRMNLNRLQVVLGLDETAHIESLEESPGLTQELQRLDFKINIIMELVGHLVSHQHPAPEEVSLRLTPAFVQWSSKADSPALDAHVQLDLFLDNRFPFPLTLFGVVDSMAVQQAGLVTVRLVEMPEQLHELWEKYIFRCHRRHVARMRQEAGGHSG